MPTSQIKLVGGNPKFSRARSMERSKVEDGSRINRIPTTTLSRSGTLHLTNSGTLHYQGKRLGSGGKPVPCIKPYASVVYDPTTSKAIFPLKEKGPSGKPNPYGNRASRRAASAIACVIDKHERVWSKNHGKFIYRKDIDQVSDDTEKYEPTNIELTPLGG